MFLLRGSWWGSSARLRLSVSISRPSGRITTTRAPMWCLIVTLGWVYAALGAAGRFGTRYISSPGRGSRLDTTATSASGSTGGNAIGLLRGFLIGLDVRGA